MNNKLEQLVKDIFAQAESGSVTIGNPGNQWRYYLRFYAKTPQKTTPNNTSYATINIPDFNLFLDKLEKYLAVASQFYEGDQEYLMLEDSNDGYVQKQILDLLINCSPVDCENIYKYIDTRTKMLKANVEIGKKELGTYNGLKIVSNITKNNRIRASFEGPYCYTTTLIDQDNNKFTLPSIVFGVADNTLHVFAVQNFGENEKKENPLVKKMDRYFRKVNKGVDLQSELAQVTPNALVALTIFFEYAQSKNKTNVEVPSYMPIRYHGNKVAGMRKLEGAEKAKWLNEHNRNQYNITNKMVNTLFRYCYHFDNSKCEFDENSLKTFLKIDSNNASCNDNILYDIANAVKQTQEDQKQ